LGSGSRVGCGVPLQQAFAVVATRTKVRGGEDAITNTPDARATQKMAASVLNFMFKDS